MQQAKYYKQVPVGKTKCVLCPHRCLLGNKKTGLCLTRQNIDGVLYVKNYGDITIYNTELIEKMPLYHYRPGTNVFAIGSWGCSFKCTFCNTWNISQKEEKTEHFEKEDIVSVALRHDATAVAYTYNEPFVNYEFVLDTSIHAKSFGLANVMVTNGFTSEEPLAELLQHLDAVTVDLKTGSESFFREFCNGQLEPVMRTIKQVFDAGVHLELSTIIIPGVSDNMDAIREVSEWIAAVSPEIPLHLTKYTPNHKMTIEATPIETLAKARDIAMDKLKYVYIPGEPADTGRSSTKCPACKTELITRAMPEIKIAGMDKDKCVKCGEKIFGKF